MARHKHRCNITVQTKPHPKPKRTWKKMAMLGPTFQAIWTDGIVTRMSIHCDDQNLDVGRGVRMSWYAYQSRTKGKGCSTEIREGRFERNGKILARYKNMDITDAGINPLDG